MRYERVLIEKADRKLREKLKSSRCAFSGGRIRSDVDRSPKVLSGVYRFANASSKRQPGVRRMVGGARYSGRRGRRETLATSQEGHAAFCARKFPGQ
jgi:hypothetical protein